jgi:hypothetical protein
MVYSISCVVGYPVFTSVTQIRREVNLMKSLFGLMPLTTLVGPCALAQQEELPSRDVFFRFSAL